MGLDTTTGSGTQRGAGLPAAQAQPATTPHPALPAQSHEARAHEARPGSERSTRARIARLILENGPVTAAGLSTRLSLTPAAVRRHLDNLLADGLIETRTARRPANRGRGRPAKLFAITDVGRSAFEHAYDDLATSALRFLAEAAGPGAVAEFARRRAGGVAAGARGAGRGGPRAPGAGPPRRWHQCRSGPGRRPGRATLP